MVDTKELVSLLPSNVTHIVGIARSGLPVASMLSLMLHVPLSIFRQSMKDVFPAGHGWRIATDVVQSGLTLIVDDTSMSGKSLLEAAECVRAIYPESKTATVYVNPNSRVKPDFFVRELPHPHLLEWNLPNSVFGPHTAMDFDGILCCDCTWADDDDGEKYHEFITTAKMKYPFRRMPIPLIVTARLEKYREPTMEWLARHGMQCSRLVMGPWESLDARRRSDVAAWKAEHYKAFLRQHHRVQPPLFVESDARQAKRIAELSGGIVVCPAAKRCYP